VEASTTRCRPTKSSFRISAMNAQESNGDATDHAIATTLSVCYGRRAACDHVLNQRERP
jgi:hypothetical protein